MLTFKQYLLESYPLARNAFMSQANESEVNLYLNKFKDLVKRNVIKPPDNDINKWRQEGWEEFKKFVFTAEQDAETTKSQLKKKLKGQANRIYESDRALVVRPLSRAASCKYGASTKWCISSKDPSHWEGYESGFAKEGTSIYFVIDKQGYNDKWNTTDGEPFEIGDDEYEEWVEMKTNPFAKIALLVDKDGVVTTAWDAHDESYKTTNLSKIENHLKNMGIPLDRLPFEFKEQGSLLGDLYKAHPQYKTDSTFQRFVDVVDKQVGLDYFEDFKSIQEIIDEFNEWAEDFR